jgi:5-(carboxyamino)imidazole ribonucleotide synthase
MNLPLSFVAIHLEKKNLSCRNGISPEANQVEYVICPARIDAKVAEKLEQLLYMYEKFNHVGLLAVEMFQTEDDEILVNEVALAHTIQVIILGEASYTSENHVRAILNLPSRKRIVRS